MLLPFINHLMLMSWGVWVGIRLSCSLARKLLWLDCATGLLHVLVQHWVASLQEARLITLRPFVNRNPCERYSSISLIDGGLV